MRSRLLSASFLLVGTLAAHADTLRTLYFSAVFQQGDTVTGTLTQDMSDDFLVAADVVSTGVYNGAMTLRNPGPGFFHGVDGFDTGNGSFTMDVAYALDNFPIPFHPFVICSLSIPCADFGSPFIVSTLSGAQGTLDAISGSITDVAPTPEPSTLALLATGVLALTALLRKRFFGSPRTEMAGGPPTL